MALEFLKERRKTEFCKAYIRTADKSSLMRKVINRIQKEGEKSAVYVREKEKLCMQLGFEVAETKNEIICGLRSRDLCQSLQLKTHNSINELLRDIEDAEAISELRREKFSRKPQADSRSSVSGQEKPAKSRRKILCRWGISSAITVIVWDILHRHVINRSVVFDVVIWVTSLQIVH